MKNARTRVKICGITRVADGLAASDAGADAIGLNFWGGTPRVVEVGRAREIADALPPFVTKVGLFVDPQVSDVRAILDAVPLDLLQFHGTETPDLCRAFGRPYLKAIHMKDGVDLLEYAALYEDAAGLLFDSFWPGDMPGGTGRAFDWSRLSAPSRVASCASDPFRGPRSRQRRRRDPRRASVGRRRVERCRGTRSGRQGAQGHQGRRPHRGVHRGSAQCG